MKKSLLLSAIIALHFSAPAQTTDFQVGDLYYSILSEEEKTVAVENGNKQLREVFINAPQQMEDMFPAYHADDEIQYGQNFEDYTGNYCSGDIIVPSTIEYNGSTYTVTTLADGAFSYCFNIESITLPETITTIGPGAFYLCYKIKELRIPQSVTEMGVCAMSMCGNLSKVYWPSLVSTIPYEAFLLYGWRMTSHWKLRI